MHLSIIWTAFQRTVPGPSAEEPKQAVQHGLVKAILGLFAAHVLPVGAAIAMVLLSVGSYYIGGELAGPSGHDDVKLSGLQFAAKLHEITIHASLSVIVVGLIRHELVAGEGIPFGAIFGSLQFSGISYLCSNEFLGTLKARFAKRIVKIRLVTLLVVGAFLALTAGPSSAIVMRPRVDDWPAGGTDFYLNATCNEIWPSIVDASSIPTSCNNITSNTTCISRDWEFARDQLLAYWPGLTDSATVPESLQLNSPKSIRLMYTRERKGLYSYSETIATTHMSNLAHSLAEIGRLWTIAAAGLSNVSPKQPRKFKYRNNVLYTLKNVYQPDTTAICRAHRDSPQLQQTLANNMVEVPTAASICNTAKSRIQYVIPPRQSAMIAGFIGEYSTYPDLQFVALPPEAFGNNTIGAFVTFPPTWPGGSKFLTCTVNARWEPVTLQSTRNVMKAVSGQPLGWPHSGCGSSLPSINVTSEWAQYLNPHIQDTNKTVFHTLVESTGVQNLSEWNDDHGFVEGITESVLTLLMTNGLSRISSSATLQGQLNGRPNDEFDQSCGRWCLDIMPKADQVFGYGGDIINLSGIPDPSKLSNFTVHVDINGYAYNMRGATTVLSCAVLILYCLLAGVHIVFVLIKRSNSNAWESVAEVTALAMQSQPTEVLKNTCAGIYTTSVFSNLVKVVRRGSHLDHLELDFGDHGTGYGDPLVENDFYG